MSADEPLIFFSVVSVMSLGDVEGRLGVEPCVSRRALGAALRRALGEALHRAPRAKRAFVVPSLPVVFLPAEGIFRAGRDRDGEDQAGNARRDKGGRFGRLASAGGCRE